MRTTKNPSKKSGKEKNLSTSSEQPPISCPLESLLLLHLRTHSNGEEREEKWAMPDETLNLTLNLR